jgi:hypothetical protein
MYYWCTVIVENYGWSIDQMNRFLSRIDLTARFVSQIKMQTVEIGDHLTNGRLQVGHRRLRTAVDIDITADVD